MGIFSSVKNYVTGGAAEVTLSFPEQVKVGETTKVEIECVGKSELKIQKVYLQVNAVEKVEVYYSSYDRDGNRDRDLATERETTYSNEIVLDNEVTLKEGETKKWKTEITIPKDAQVTYDGINAKHYWQLQAALDVAGNDPDSGWVKFKVVS